MFTTSGSFTSVLAGPLGRLTLPEVGQYVRVVRSLSVKAGSGSFYEKGLIISTAKTSACV